MYGLPTDFDAGCFIGRTLEQICFNQNQVAWHFDSKIAIISEAPFLYRENAASPKTEISIPVVTPPFLQLIGDSVRGASGNPNGTLRIEFESGPALEFVDASKQYESYRISIGARKEIIV